MQISGTTNMINCLKRYMNRVKFVNDFNVPFLDLPWVAKDFCTYFNNAVALDLTPSDNKSFILYLVDLSTKFTQGCFMKNQIPGTTVDSVIQVWIEIEL